MLYLNLNFKTLGFFFEFAPFVFAWHPIVCYLQKKNTDPIF